jgi:hypothetical protein
VLARLSEWSQKEFGIAFWGANSSLVLAGVVRLRTVATMNSWLLRAVGQLRSEHPRRGRASCDGDHGFRPLYFLTLDHFRSRSHRLHAREGRLQPIRLGQPQTFDLRCGLQEHAPLQRVLVPDQPLRPFRINRF